MRERQEWLFFRSLHKADRGLATAWWSILALRGVLPALLAVAMGALISAVEGGDPLGTPLTVVGIVFVLMQVLYPIHAAVSGDLGDRTAAWLYDQLTDACLAPPGIGHLEEADLADDLQVARDFDRGMTGPPLRISMDFIADGLALMLAGLGSAAVLFAFAWWAPLVLAGGWLATHWLLRESGVWKDRNTDEVRRAQRDADYAYRLAVDAPAAKELRLFGLRGLDAGPVRRPPDEAARAAVRGHPDAGALGAQQPGRGRRRQPAGVLAAGRRRVGRVDRPRPAGHVRAGRHRGVGHRLRRAELGAGRGRRSRGRRACA